jgi:hypothetical protein
LKNSYAGMTRGRIQDSCNSEMKIQESNFKFSYPLADLAARKGEHRRLEG